MDPLTSLTGFERIAANRGSLKDNYTTNRKGPNSFFKYSLFVPRYPPLLFFIQEVHYCLNTFLHTRNEATGSGHFCMFFSGKYMYGFIVHIKNHFTVGIGVVRNGLSSRGNSGTYLGCNSHLSAHSHVTVFCYM